MSALTLKSFILFLGIGMSLGSSQSFASEEPRRTREEMLQIMDTCSESAGLRKPPEGGKPTAPNADQIAAIDACMLENNVSPPARRLGTTGNSRSTKSKSVKRSTASAQ